MTDNLLSFVNLIDQNVQIAFQKISNFIDSVNIFFIILLIYVMIILFIAMIFGFNWLIIKGIQLYKKNEKIILKYIKFAKL